MMRNILKKANEKKAVLLGILFIICICLLFLISGIRSAGKEREAKELRLEREAAESVYISDLRNYLNEQGYYNSGVNLTKTWDGEEEYEYQISVHNDRLNRAEEGLKEELKRNIVRLGSQLNCSDIQVKFI